MPFDSDFRPLTGSVVVAGPGRWNTGDTHQTVSAG
jgi:hypothetical protein